jgi:hypothetical protein
MRQCLMDLGRKYMKRIFIYSSVLMAGSLVFLIIRTLSVFQVIDFRMSLLTFMFSGFDGIFVLGIILLMLYYGAQVNQQYTIDQLKLAQLK